MPLVPEAQSIVNAMLTGLEKSPELELWFKEYAGTEHRTWRFFRDTSGPECEFGRAAIKCFAINWLRGGRTAKSFIDIKDSFCS